MDFSFEQLHSWVCTHNAIRRVMRLQPAAGQGDTIFPSTYPGDLKDAGPMHALQVMRIGAKDVHCVIIDSVQSQANRLELALMSSVCAGTVTIPHLEIDFSEAGIDYVGRKGRYSSLEAPHRIYDAAFRDSALPDGRAFMETPLGQGLTRANTTNATSVLTLSPNALLFGAWHSQGFRGDGNGTGTRFARCLASEIIGINVPVEDVFDPRTGAIAERRTAGRRTSSRIDQLGIIRGVPIYKGKTNWSDREEEVEGNATLVRPSEINHGSITPSIEPVGVTMEYAEQRTVLTFAGLRRLCFDGGPEKSSVARAYLAALGVLACAEQDVCGYALRSRCDLIPEKPAPYEVIAPDGTTSTVQIDLAGARELYKEALAAVLAAGFEMQLTPTRLIPQRKLASIIKQSRDRTLTSDDTEAEPEGGRDAHP
jgi:CRISPR-associated protein Csb1